MKNTLFILSMLLTFNTFAIESLVSCKIIKDGKTDTCLLGERDSGFSLMGCNLDINYDEQINNEVVVVSDHIGFKVSYFSADISRIVQSKIYLYTEFYVESIQDTVVTPASAFVADANGRFDFSTVWKKYKITCKSK